MIKSREALRSLSLATLVSMGTVAYLGAEASGAAPKSRNSAITYLAQQIGRLGSVYSSKGHGLSSNANINLPGGEMVELQEESAGKTDKGRPDANKVDSMVITVFEPGQQVPQVNIVYLKEKGKWNAYEDQLLTSSATPETNIPNNYYYSIEELGLKSVHTYISISADVKTSSDFPVSFNSPAKADSLLKQLELQSGEIVVSAVEGKDIPSLLELSLK
jgi:hypothetical protein